MRRCLKLVCRLMIFQIIGFVMACAGWWKVISHEPKFLNKICTHVWISETQKSANVDRLLLLLTRRVGLSHTRFVDSPVLPSLVIYLMVHDLALHVRDAWHFYFLYLPILYGTRWWHMSTRSSNTPKAGIRFWLSMSIQSMPQDTLQRFENTRAKGLIKSPSSTGKAISTSLRRRRVSAEWGFPDVPATLDSPLMAASTSHKKRHNIEVIAFVSFVCSGKRPEVATTVAYFLNRDIFRDSSIKVAVCYVCCESKKCIRVQHCSDRSRSMQCFRAIWVLTRRRRAKKKMKAIPSSHSDRIHFYHHHLAFISRFSTKIFGQAFAPSKRITPWEHCQSLWKMWPGDAPKVWSWIQNCQMINAFFFLKVGTLSQFAVFICVFCNKDTRNRIWYEWMSLKRTSSWDVEVAAPVTGPPKLTFPIPGSMEGVKSWAQIWLIWKMDARWTRWSDIHHPTTWHHLPIS